MLQIVRGQRIMSNLTRSKYGIGKLIFGTLYLHHSCVDLINNDTIRTNIQIQMKQAINLPYNIIKYNIKENKTTFIQCTDFDVANEPLPDWYFNFKNNKLIQTKGLQIWHHKWMFVGDDYTGFDVAMSMLRSAEWMTAMEHIDYKKIGQPEYWDKQLEKYNLTKRK